MFRNYYYKARNKYLENLYKNYLQLFRLKILLMSNIKDVELIWFVSLCLFCQNGNLGYYLPSSEVHAVIPLFNSFKFCIYITGIIYKNIFS
jgi:hypothetical protein